MDIVTLALARKYVEETAQGLGAVKGSPCTIKSITEGEDGSTVVFAWTGVDGVEQTSTTFLPRGPKGEPGKDGSGETAFDLANCGLPVLYLNGDTTGMSKDDAVDMSYVYGNLSGTASVKWQGSSSINYPKKNYTVKFDQAFEAKEGWGAQKKYCMKANWIDASHARNVVNAKLWGQICASRKPTNTTLAACPNWGAVDGFPIVIAINGQFHGLYTFNVPKDGWMANMGNGTQEAILCADKQNAPCQFKGEVTLENDFDLEYATDENNVEWVKTSMNELINACIMSDGSNIDTTIASLCDIASAIDYLCFVPFVTGLDMCGKNYLLLKRDGEPWTFGAYDMDCTYSLNWNGSKFESALDKPNLAYFASYHKLMGLLASYKADTVKARWKELRKTVLSEDNIYQQFINFAGLIPKAVKEAEAKKWPTIPNSDANTIYQVFNQLRLRLPVLDAEVEALVQESVIPAPMLAAGLDWFDADAAGVEQSAITAITYSSTYEPTGNEDAIWACDVDGNGDIMAYRNGTEITITPTTGATRIRLNPASDGMLSNSTQGGGAFSALAEVNGTEMWVANSGTSMQCLLMGNTLITEPVCVPDGATAINSIFYGCRALRHPPVLPEGANTMRNAFISCTALQELPNIPSTAIDMEYFAFGCTALTDVDITIPAGVKVLSYAFRGCRNLNGSIEINATNLQRYDDCFLYACMDSGAVTLTGSCPLLAEIAATNTQGKVTVAS